jgi:hypothetical protein
MDPIPPHYFSENLVPWDLWIRNQKLFLLDHKGLFDSLITVDKYE